jgi:hypothetical protein
MGEIKYPTEKMVRDWFAAQRSQHCPKCGETEHELNGAPKCNCGLTWVSSSSSEAAALPKPIEKMG